MLKICNYVENGLLDPPIMLKISVIMSKNDDFMLKLSLFMLKMLGENRLKTTKIGGNINNKGGTWPPSN